MRIIRGGMVALALAATMMTHGPAVGQSPQQERPWYKNTWDPANVKACDRQCLVGIAEAYLRALETKDMSALPVAEQVTCKLASAFLSCATTTRKR